MQFKSYSIGGLRGFRFNTLFALLSPALLVGCQSSSPSQTKVERVDMSALMASEATTNTVNTVAPTIPQSSQTNDDTQRSIENVESQPTVQPSTLAATQPMNPISVAQGNAVVNPTTSTTAMAMQPLVMQIIASSADGKSVQAILQSALTYFDNHASADAVIQQRQAETVATERQAYPDIKPVAGVGKNQPTQFGLEMNYTLFDFGLNNAQVAQRQLDTDNAIINKHLEQTKRLSETLIELGEVAELQARIGLTSRTLSNINQLLQLAQSRQASGVDNGSDEMLLSIKSSELTTEIHTLEKQRDLSLSLLSRQLVTPITLNEVPTLPRLLALINTPTTELKHAPQLQQAEKLIARAKEAVKAEQRSLYPKVVVSAGGYKNVKGESDTQLNLSLQTPTGIFSGAASVKAQEAALFAAERDYERLANDIQTELTRLDLETQRLQQNLQTFDAFIAQTQSSIDLFNSQFKISQASIADGISPYSTLLRTQVERNNALLELIRIKANRLPLVIPSPSQEK